MSRFKEFVSQTQGRNLLVSGEAKAETAVVVTASSFGLPTPKAEALASKAVSLIQSDEAVTQMSDQIGTPRDGETEDEFVARASDVARNVLRGMLKAKK